MSIHLLRYLLILSALVLALTVHAQRHQVYPEKLHGDIDRLFSELKRLHPDPFRYTPEYEMSRIVKAIKDSVRVPMDGEQFAKQLIPLFKAVGDAGCEPQLPRAVTKELLHEWPLLPMKVRILEDGVFLEEELKGFRSIPSGSRLTSINGRPMNMVIDGLADRIFTNGHNHSHVLWRLENELHLLYALYFERTNSYDVGFVPPGGREEFTKVFSMTGDEIARTRRPAGATLAPWGAQRGENDHYMWLTIRSMDLNALTAAGQRADKFIDALLAELTEYEVNTLVIDLRGAGGNDIALASQLLAAVAREPFQLLARSERNEEAFNGDGTVGPALATAHGSVPSSADISVTEYRAADPHPNAYQGRLYVICDGGTREAAAAFTMAVDRSGRARTFGSMNGSNSIAYTGSLRTITLPASALQVSIPTERSVLSGSSSAAPDLADPVDHKLTTDPRALMLGQDGVKLSLLRLISAVQ